jgi:hypothetical protein
MVRYALQRRLGQSELYSPLNADAPLDYKRGLDFSINQLLTNPVALSRRDGD